MATLVPHSNFDAMFVMYNHLRRRLDAALTKKQLTLTSLQVLTAVGQANERRREILSTHLGQSLGLSKGTISVVVKQLTSKGWIAAKEAGLWPTRNYPLVLTKSGRQKMHEGLVVREDVLGDFAGLLSARDRAAMMRIAGSVVAKIGESHRLAHKEAAIESFKGYKRRALVRRLWADE